MTDLTGFILSTEENVKMPIITLECLNPILIVLNLICDVTHWVCACVL